MVRVLREGVKVLGKSALGRTGFCLNRTKVQSKQNGEFDNFSYSLQHIMNSVCWSKERKLIMTSMTEIQDIDVQGGDYIPTVVTYDAGIYGQILNPKVMLEAKAGKLKTLPTADFIVWNRNEYPNTKVATFSKTAPIMLFESTSGMSCLGTVLRKPLVNNFEYIIKKIFDEMGVQKDEVVDVTIVTATGFKYAEGTIADMVKEKLGNMQYKTRFSQLVTVEEWPDELYQKEEFGNHVVVIDYIS